MRKTVSWLEIVQTADELVIRLRRKAVVLCVLGALVGLPASISIAYKNIVGTPAVPALRDRPAGDQIFVGVICLVIFAFWGILPLAGIVLNIRQYRRPWVFNLPRMQVTRLDRSWPLADVTTVAVDVCRKTFGGESAGVVLYYRDAATLEIERFSAGRNMPLSGRIIEATALANLIGEFCQVPVRHPLPSERGFDVVMPVRSASDRKNV